MSAVSGNYRELQPSEVPEVAARCAEAWKDPSIPNIQYALCTKVELEQFRRGEVIAPFAALLQCWHRIPWAAGYHPSVLDVGASSGYYREILNTHDIRTNYTAFDFSEAFAERARATYPGIAYDVGDARSLPYENNSFDVVLTGACIMHILDYPAVIREIGGVASRYAIFHRTPVWDRPTTFFEKEAYGVPCLEIWFNEAELMTLFAKASLKVIFQTDVFRDESQGFSHRSYVLEKEYELFHHPV